MKYMILPVIVAGFWVSSLCADDGLSDADRQRKQIAEWQQEATNIMNAYREENSALRVILRGDDLEAADVVAMKILELAAWKPQDPSVLRRYLQTSIYETGLDLARRFAEKRLYGADYTRKFYEKAIAAAETASEKAPAMLEYAGFLYDNALIPESEARKMMQDAMSSRGISAEERVGLYLARARMCDCLEFEEYIDKAFAAAGNDAALILETYQAQFPQRNDPEIIIKSPEMLFDIAQKALADKKIVEYLYEDVSPQTPSLVSFLVGKFNADPFYKYAESLRLLDEAIKVAPDAATRNKWRKLKLDTHWRAAERYYTTPDPGELAAMRGVLLEMLPDQATDIDIARVKVGLMDINYKLGHLKEMNKYADELLRDYSEPEKTLPTVITTVNMYLGLAAYDDEDYAKALEYWAPLAEDEKILNNHRAIEDTPTYTRRELWAAVIESIIRGYCAVGDYEKAYALKDVLLPMIHGRDRPVYTIYFEGLAKRVSTGK